MTRDRAVSRSVSFAYVGLAYLAAAAAAWAAGAWLGDGAPAWQIIMVADGAATVVVFAFSVAADNSSVYDPYWSVAPMVIAPWLVARAAPGVPLVRQIVVVALVMAWGARLTWNWARGWQGLAHEDWRYVEI